MPHLLNNRTALSAGVALLMAALTPMSVRAQDEGDLASLSLEQLMDMRVDHVYGASRYEQKVTRAPASVSVITAEEIRRYGHATLADVLASVRSLYVSNDRNYSYLGVRGFLRPGDYNSRVLVLIDGHRINDNLFDSGTIEREGMIEVELIDRVEVIRGPGSSMYGSSAFLGVINVITRRGGDLGGVELAADGESFEGLRARLSYGEKLANGLDVLASAAHYSSNGPQRLYFPEFDQRISEDPRAANDGVAVGLDDEEAWNLFASARYGGFSLSGLYVDRTKNVPTAPFGAAFNARSWTWDERAYVDVRHEHRFSDDLRMQTAVSVDEYRYAGKYPYNYADPEQTPEIIDWRDGTVGQWLGAEWQLNARARDRHTLVVGASWRENIREFQYSYEDFDPPLYTLSDERSSSTYGAFAQAEIELHPDLVLTGGARYDHYETFGGHLSPRAALIYGASPNSVLKALYGHAFRAPNPYELYYNPEQQLRPTLEPEGIDTYELVYEHYLGERLRMSVSAYQYEVEDLITQRLTEAGDYYYSNLDRSRARGLELEAAATLPGGLMANASMAFQRSSDVRTGHELSSSPRRMAKLNVSAPLFDRRATGGVEFQYQSEAHTLRGGRADAFVVVNTSLTSRALWRGLDASLTIRNLFNTRYGYAGAEDHLQEVIEQDGRTWRASLTYRF